MVPYSFSMVFPNMGRGVVATKHFQRNDFICEYKGELINGQEADRRNAKHGKLYGPAYMYYFRYQEKRILDATRDDGSLGRLINHAIPGNADPKLKVINGTPKIMFFAKCEISIGTQIMYDYGERRKEMLQNYPWLQRPNVTFTMRLPEVIRVPVEAEATLTVELSQPDVEVKWFKKSEEIKETERFTFFSEGTIRRLVIRKVKIEDQSDYSCVMLSAKTSTKLIVEVCQAIPIIEVPKNEYKVKKGSDVSMEVNFISTPPPTDEWSVNGTVIKKSNK
ncbi:hypothetical protein FOCC_FOCC015455, partial [Frankliniella occidentalis]